MICAWAQLLGILPQWMRSDVDIEGKDTMEELRLRMGYEPELICHNRTTRLKRTVSQQDLNFVINTASRYSPWSAETLSHGFLTAAGGHRIGVSGDAIIKEGVINGIRIPRSLCIRVARDFPEVTTTTTSLHGSILIIGRPGSGKTTLLRSLIRQRSEMSKGSIGVVDERGEIFPAGAEFRCGRRTDVLTGVSKEKGIEILLRVMGPTTIAVDEITSKSDCEALIRSAWCGVSLIATAHASDKKDLLERNVYKPLVNCGIFNTLITLKPDKSWTAERMAL